MSLKGIAKCTIGVYGARVALSESTMDAFLADAIRASLFFGCFAKAKDLQLNLSRRQLFRASPSEWRANQLERRLLQGATVSPDTDVLRFFTSVYRNQLGLTSSWLSQGEGKTLSCLQVLEDIEKNNPDSAFLLVSVRNRPIEAALRETLHIHPKIRVEDVVADLTLSTRIGSGRRPQTIYGLIDQVEEWFDTDNGILRCLVCQQHENLRIHVPCGIPEVALRFDKVNGKHKYKSKCLGSAGKDGIHEFSVDQAESYIRSFCHDSSRATAILERAKNTSVQQNHPLCPRLCAEASRLVD